MNLKSLLIDFVRGRILWCALQPPNEVQAKDALNHRFAQNYMPLQPPSSGIYTSSVRTSTLHT
jgi:hypothetical protein